jgi:hypothetical protein
MLDSGPLSGFRNFDLPGTRTVVKPTGALAMASPGRRATHRLARGLSDRSGDPINRSKFPQRASAPWRPARSLRALLCSGPSPPPSLRLLFIRRRVAGDIEIRKSNANHQKIKWRGRRWKSIMVFYHGVTRRSRQPRERLSPSFFRFTPRGSNARDRDVGVGDRSGRGRYRD